MTPHPKVAETNGRDEGSRSVPPEVSPEILARRAGVPLGDAELRGPLPLRRCFQHRHEPEASGRNA